MQVKVCGLKEISNIGQVVNLQPEYTGFIFYPPSPRYVGHDKALQQYARSITTVKKVGVFVNTGYSAILEAIDRYHLDAVQLHGEEPASFCACLSGHIPVIKAFRINDRFDFGELDSYKTACTFFLFDTASAVYGGSGLSFNWSLLEKYRLSVPFFLSGGIHPGLLAQVRLFSHPAFAGIDVNSGFETTPGIKNIDQLKLLFDEIRN